MSVEDVSPVVVQVGALLSREGADVHIRMDAPRVDEAVANIRNDEEPEIGRERQVQRGGPPVRGATRGEVPAARFESLLADTSKIDRDLRCYDDVLGFIAEVRDRMRCVRVIPTAFPRGIRDAAFRRLLKCDLYDYPREGASFAASAGRSLVGDEMGLGKTVDALAAVEIMAQQFVVERVLIVCPTSLKPQWDRRQGPIRGLPLLEPDRPRPR